MKRFRFWMAQKLAPGILIQPFEWHDWNDTIVVNARHSFNFNIITINGRDLYFRKDGSMDGTGMSMPTDQQINEFQAEALRDRKKPTPTP